jgi:hypothetical protein
LKWFPAQQSAGCVCIHDISFLVITPGSDRKELNKNSVRVNGFTAMDSGGARAFVASTIWLLSEKGSPIFSLVPSDHFEFHQQTLF